MPRGQHEHVGVGHGGAELGVAQRAAEGHGVVEAHLVDEAVQGRRVGRHDRPAHDLERRRRVVVRPGDEERHHGELDPLVRGEAADADPAGARPRAARARSARPPAPVGTHGGGRDHRGAAEAGVAQLGLVEGRDRQAERRCGAPARAVPIWARSWWRAMPLSQGA